MKARLRRRAGVLLPLVVEWPGVWIQCVVTDPPSKQGQRVDVFVSLQDVDDMPAAVQ